MIEALYRGRRPHLARHQRHVLFAAGEGRARRKHHGQKHRRARPGARPIVRFGAGLGLPPRGPGVHFVGRLDARNLDGRAETLVPIENPTVHEQIPGQIMEANLDSDAQSWILRSHGLWRRFLPGAKRESPHV
jgi:hypothetical protein